MANRKRVEIYHFTERINFAFAALKRNNGRGGIAYVYSRTEFINSYFKVGRNIFYNIWRAINFVYESIFRLPNYFLMLNTKTT